MEAFYTRRGVRRGSKPASVVASAIPPATGVGEDQDVT
jgi:hypothetical protein